MLALLCSRVCEFCDSHKLTLGHDLSLGLDCGFITLFLERAEVVHNSLDERLLKVSVNDTGGLGGLDAVADGPLAHFIGSGSEEASEVERLAHGNHNLGDGGSGAKFLALLGRLLFRLETGEALLERHRYGNDGAARGFLLEPFRNLGQMLVLLADIVSLTKVDQVDTGLGGQKEERVDYFDLVSTVSGRPFSTPLSILPSCAKPPD